VFGETGAGRLRQRLESYEGLYSANLLEAELRAALAREGAAWAPEFVARIGWVLPGRPLSAEMARVLVAGYLRGADVWHVACALHLHDALGELDFLTLDGPQRQVAAAAGLPAPSL
jgi:hypothetical protein